MNCIYPSPLLRYLGEGRIRLVLPANYEIKECRKTPPLSYLRCAEEEVHTLFVAAVDITPSLLPCPVALQGVSVFSIGDI